MGRTVGCCTQSAVSGMMFAHIAPGKAAQQNISQFSEVTHRSSSGFKRSLSSQEASPVTPASPSPPASPFTPGQDGAQQDQECAGRESRAAFRAKHTLHVCCCRDTVGSELSVSKGCTAGHRGPSFSLRFFLKLCG